MRLARPTMEAIGDDTHETVHLSVARGDRVVQVAQVDSRYLLGTRDWTEVDVPAHCSALGKVFLGWGVLPAPEGGLLPLTGATITDPARLRVEVTAGPPTGLGGHDRRARGRPHRHRRTCARSSRATWSRHSESRGRRHGWRAGSTRPAAVCSNVPHELSALLRGLPPQEGVA